jgi:hypothetical protein
LLGLVVAWRGQATEQRAVYGNRRRVRGERGQQLQRQMSEKLERAVAHMYETGGTRRMHVRGDANISKRLLIHACFLNLGLLMRFLYRVGMTRPAEWRRLCSTLPCLPYIHLPTLCRADRITSECSDSPRR